jgi:hypothetical protein
MPFLFAVTFLCWAHIIAMFRSLGRKDQRHWPHYLTVFTLALGTLDAFYLSPLNRWGVPGDARNWTPLAVLVFGVLSIWVFGRKFYTIHKSGEDPTKAGWRAGISLSCVVLGIYLGAASVDHWVFFRDPDRSGVADASALDVGDVECAQMVLVRFIDAGAEYRCPRSIAVGMMAANPFVPWPSYVAGHSVQLRNAIERAQRGSMATLPAENGNSRKP